VDTRLYAFLKYTAIVLGVAWLGWSIYDGLFAHRAPGDQDYFAGNRAFEDGNYESALTDYDAALGEAPDHLYALRGRARTLMQLGRNDVALEAFNAAIARDPEFAATYANRGILHDRMGHTEQAMADYERALQLDPSIAEGPHWLTRFLRNQAEKPPGIADRLAYLKEEMKKPEGERLLQVPEVDSAQRPYNK
jgi:tetratricopeptide (TPR) repeat protein